MSTATMVTDLPADAGLFFGGYPYGLEPLTLPSPVVPDDVPGHQGQHGPPMQDYERACRLILRTEGPAPAVNDPPAHELYWFRWITGHQVSFVVWAVMARTLRDLRAGRVAQPAALTALRHYVRGYAAMLLYTSSCPRQVYHDLIRPSMYLQHRGFSGSWAPDYQPVRKVFQGKGFADLRSPEDLSSAVRLCQTVHSGVAKRLLQDGRSLLLESASVRRACEARLHGNRLFGVLYDNYFMTLRTAVSWPDITAQLLRRLVAISQDLTANGLYPSPAAAREWPAELRSAEVVRIEHNLPGVNEHVARWAVGTATGVLHDAGQRNGYSAMNGHTANVA